MDRILDSMFENLVIYAWMDCTENGCDRAVILRAEDVDKAKEFTEYISDKTTATSFEHFKHLLEMYDIEYYDLYDKIDIYEFGDGEE